MSAIVVGGVVEVEVGVEIDSDEDPQSEYTTQCLVVSDYVERRPHLKRRRHHIQSAAYWFVLQAERDVVHSRKK